MIIGSSGDNLLVFVLSASGGSHPHFSPGFTLRVSNLDTPSFDVPDVTALGEGVRQKILIRQVFNRCVIVWDRQGVLSCIPHLPYPGETLGGRFQKDIFILSKNLGKKTGKHLV